MNNKILRGELENDSIEHFRGPSTPKHNRGRKRLRRSIKRKEARFAKRFLDDSGQPTLAERNAEDELSRHNFSLDEWSGWTDYAESDMQTKIRHNLRGEP